MEKSEENENYNIDPQTEQKLTQNRARIMSYIEQERPRFILPFEKMEFSENRLTITVPSEGLKEEINSTRSELATKIAQLCSVNGYIDINIIVAEIATKLRPVLLEDRMRHIVSRTPLYAELKAALELEVE